MKQRDSILAIMREPFAAGLDENLSPIMHHLWKLEGGAIYFCHNGWAHVTIDLKDYEIVPNTQLVLLPGTIIRINGSSSDFTASFFGFPKEMFREACLRFEPIFYAQRLLSTTTAKIVSETRSLKIIFNLSCSIFTTNVIATSINTK